MIAASVTFLPYQDVFILGDTNAIQAVLEDCEVTLSIINYSGYVGVMKQKVDDLMRTVHYMHSNLGMLSFSYRLGF